MLVQRRQRVNAGLLQRDKHPGRGEQQQQAAQAARGRVMAG